MATFVLIHGAWHGGWSWERLAPELKARGHAVRAPDLPSHGADPADPAAVTLEDYAARVAEVLRAAPEPAILVGHSMGGMPISAAAEAAPERVRALVYLCAFLPRDGESLMDVEGRNPRSTVPASAVPDAEGRTLTVPADRHRDLFYGDVDPEVMTRAQGRLTPQPAAPFQDRVALGAGFAGVPKHYVECLRDGAISIELQRDMAGATRGVTVHSLDSDHSPMLSRPVELADLLHRITADG